MGSGARTAFTFPLGKAASAVLSRRCLESLPSFGVGLAGALRGKAPEPLGGALPRRFISSVARRLLVGTSGRILPGQVVFNYWASDQSLPKKCRPKKGRRIKVFIYRSLRFFGSLFGHVPQIRFVVVRRTKGLVEVGYWLLFVLWRRLMFITGVVHVLLAI